MTKKILSYLFYFIVFILIILFLIYQVFIDSLNTYQALTSFGAIIIGFFYYQRNSIFEKQLMQKDNQYIKDSEFKNFLESTKLLTTKESTIETKISALFLLYDVAKAHPENIDRIIQVINKQLTPLMRCIEESCDNRKYTSRLVKSKISKYPKNRINTIEYIEKNNINIDLTRIDAERIIKEWQYKGNDTEKLISVSLYILRKIILNILPSINKEIELSNTIIFDIDTDFDKKLILKSEKRPTENLIFINCKLNNVNFKKTKYHFATFINCDLTHSNFNDSNLWGTLFNNCNLKDVKFKDAECEGVEFRNCKNLVKSQIEIMKFQNAKDNKKYLIILENSLNLEDDSYFTTINEFNGWRYPID